MTIKYIFYLCLSLLFVSSCDILNDDGNSYLNGFISGTFRDWNQGDNKVLRFGQFDEGSQTFVEYGKAYINSDGSFSFDTLFVPPRALLEPVNNGPTGEGNCSGDMVISNPNSLIGFGEFIVTEEGSNNKMGYALRTNNPDFYQYPRADSYMVDYIYSARYVSADGTSYCEKSNNGKTFHEIVYAEVFLNEGWNKVTERITYLSPDSLVREVGNFDPSNDYWVFIQGDQHNEEQFNFNYSGQIENWTLGNNNRLVFGGMDYQADRFKTYATAQIDGNGNFSFSTASAALNNTMRPAIEIFRNQTSCTVNLQVSNENVKFSLGDFIIIDNTNERAIGNVNYGLETLDPEGRNISKYKIRFFFANGSTNVTGNTVCLWDSTTGRKIDKKEFNIYFYDGWNAVYDGFEKVENDTAYFKVNNSIPSEAKWYYHQFEEGR